MIGTRAFDSFGVVKGMSKVSAGVFAILALTLFNHVKCFAQTEQPDPGLIAPDAAPYLTDANAAPFPPGVKADLFKLVTEGMQDYRGGKLNYIQSPTEFGQPEGKPLGCYLVAHEIVFGSGYKELAPKTIVEWVYDLNEYVAANGGWTPNGWLENPFPYKKIRRDFARAWWLNHSVPFSDLIGCAQDAWIYEAILDGANIWWTYQQYLHQKTWDVDDIEQKQDLLLDYMLVDLMDVFSP